MIEAGNSIRAAEGPGALARRLLPRLLGDRNYVVDSIRHPAEVEILREAGERFQLIWIDADEAVRFRRIRERGRPGDPETIDEFRSLEERELGSDDSFAQQLLAVRALADETLDNDGSIERLHEAIQALLKKSLYFERPGWDDYFMSIARVVAMRSNGVKRKGAAVVTVDRRIISTGYNGTPRATAAASCSFRNEKSGFGYSADCKYASVGSSPSRRAPVRNLHE